jgi:hypothetical protein
VLAVTAHPGIVIAVALLSVALYFCYGHAPRICTYAISNILLTVCGPVVVAVVHAMRW